MFLHKSVSGMRLAFTFRVMPEHICKRRVSTAQRTGINLCRKPEIGFIFHRYETEAFAGARPDSGCIDISESTLYPILRRLEEAGRLTVYSVEHRGRLRKFYHITPDGITFFDKNGLFYL